MIDTTTYEAMRSAVLANPDEAWGGSFLEAGVIRAIAFGTVALALRVEPQSSLSLAGFAASINYR